MRIVSCRILRLFHSEGEKSYYIEAHYENGITIRGYSIPFKDIEGKNGIVRYPSINKARDWLNSPGGLLYLNERIGEHDPGQLRPSED